LYEPYDVFTEEACKQEAINRSENESFWAVCLKETGKLIGNIYLSAQEFETWELGYVFNKDYQKQGFATEASKILLNYVFKDKSAHRVVAMCNPKNESSWKLLERLGMRREGYLIKNIYFHKDQNGQPIWKDTYEYAILASDWNGNT
jgi:RimJ/RimL family protein N-acetyltransferase